MLLATGVIGLIYISITRRGKYNALAYCILCTSDYISMTWENWAVFTILLFVGEVFSWWQ